MILAWLIAALTALEPGETPDARVHAEAAAQAWSQGDLAEAGEHAVQAYDALAGTSCFVTPDAARLAFMAGVASQAGQIDGYSGYYFWAARQLDRAAGGLQQSERYVIRRLHMEPGRRPREDRRYASSPLLTDPHPRAARGCSPILPALEADPSLQGVALVIAWARYPLGQYTRLQTIYAYPDSAGRALAQRITGTYNRFQSSRTRVLHTFVFEPCYTAYDEARLPVELCIEGAPAP